MNKYLIAAALFVTLACPAYAGAACVIRNNGYAYGCISMTDALDVTPEMYQAWNQLDSACVNTLTHPDLYTQVDLNNCRAIYDKHRQHVASEEAKEAKSAVQKDQALVAQAMKSSPDDNGNVLMKWIKEHR